jgi:hypothetical protein
VFGPRDKGIGYLVGAGDSPEIARSAYIDVPGAEAIAARARALREKAGTITGHAAGETTEPEGPARSILSDLDCGRKPFSSASPSSGHRSTASGPRRHWRPHSSPTESSPATSAHTCTSMRQSRPTVRRRWATPVALSPRWSTPGATGDTCPRRAAGLPRNVLPAAGRGARAGPTNCWTTPHPHRCPPGYTRPYPPIAETAAMSSHGTEGL